MPNWTTNEIRFTGNKETIKKIIAEIQSCCDKQEGVMRHFIPRPKTYDEYDTTNHDPRKFSIGQILCFHSDDTNEWEKVTVTRRLKDEWMSALNEQKEKFGAIGWYDWNIKNWGCKWDFFECHYIGDDCIGFDTPWNAPFAFIVTLSKMYTDVEIFLQFCDEGENCCYAYKFNNGEMEESKPTQDFEEDFIWVDEEEVI